MEHSTLTSFLRRYVVVLVGTMTLVSGFSSSVFLPRRQHTRLVVAGTDTALLSTATHDAGGVARRAVLASLLLSTAVAAPVTAATGQTKTSQYASRPAATKAASDPKQAYQGLLQARGEIVAAEALLTANKKGGAVDMEAVRGFLTAESMPNMAAFESNGLAILRSNQVSDEDKKAIGTIRRFGVAADVMIMYGGALAEVDEMNDDPDPAVVKKFLKRAKDSLDEVILICKNNGF